jgi:hypothetical protein
MSRALRRRSPKVQAGGPHEGAGLDRALDADPIAVSAGVLLYRDGIGTAWQQAAGEDAHGLAGPELLIVGAPGRRAADQAQGGFAGRQIRRAHRIAIHCRGVAGRLIALGDQIAREHPASGGRKVHPLCRQGREGADDARVGLFDREHQSAV